VHCENKVFCVENRGDSEKKGGIVEVLVLKWLKCQEGGLNWLV